MPHFADFRWNSPCGLVKKIYGVYGDPSSTSATLLPAGTGALDIIDGSYTAPRNGFVRVSIAWYNSVIDSSVGAAGKLQIAATDVLGNSRTLQPITGSVALDALSYTETSPQVISAVLYCKAGTTVKVQWNMSAATVGDGKATYYIAWEMDR